MKGARSGKAPSAAAPAVSSGARAAATRVPPRSGIAFVDGRRPAPFVQRACKCAGPGSCDACKDSPVVQKAAMPGASSPAVAVATPVPAGGRPLDGGVRSAMEHGFGRSFSHVRVHTGPAAERSAESMGARAYTLGDDIVFNRGEYRPGTAAGRHLLAHELAHTIQQGGLQRAAVDASGAAPNEARLEAEADHAADAVVAGRAAPALSRVGGLSPLRRKLRTPPTTEAEAKAVGHARTYDQEPPEGTEDIVERVSEIYQGPGGTAQAFWLSVPFPLPPTKGRLAYDHWQSRAAAGALETVWKRNSKVELKQKRDATTDLRSSWLQKVGWDPGKAAASWAALRCAVEAGPAGSAGGEFLPRVSKDPKAKTSEDRTCHMDHVVELQMQGTNVPANVALLDGDDNVASGGEIQRLIQSLGERIQKATPRGARYIILHFQRVARPKEPKSGPCVEIEARALEGPAAPKRCGTVGKADPAAGGADRKTLRAGGSEATVAYDRKGTQPFAIAGPATQLIPGLLLQTLRWKGSTFHVDAAFDDSSGTRIPLSLVGSKASAKASTITMDVDETDTVRLAKRDAGLLFHYPYLSDGRITALDVGPKGVSGVGRLKPSIPLLRELDLEVRFGPERLEVASAIPADKLRVPIPGVTVTKAELSLLLYPEFLPSGTIEFRVGPQAKPIALAALKVGKDGEGFFARGDVRVFLPGVEEARGELVYRRSGLTGSVHVDAKQFKLPVPGMSVKQGTLDVGFAGGTIAAAGRVVVGLPRGQEAELSLAYRGKKWLFEGTGTFRVPPLQDFVAKVAYDGEHFLATGRTSLAYRGFVASVDVTYRNGKVSGKGKLDFAKGRVKGHAMVEVDDAMRLSGTGSVTVEISKDLVGTAGIELRKDGGVRVTGAITVPRPIVLFAGFGAKKNLFALNKSFPVPGLSIGPLGVNAVIGASLDTEYSIGPASLVGTTLTLALNPFDDKPSPEVGVKASLVLPASAGISASITGGLALELGLARAGGEIKITGGANVKGKAGADVDIKYTPKRLEVKGNAMIEAGLVLNLGIKAVVYGEVGAWKFKKRWAKEWDLLNRSFDTGLGFKLRAPFGYATGEGAKLPTMGEIQIEKPKLDVQTLVSKLVGSARQTEKER